MEIGQVVCSLKGRDKGYLLVVTEFTDKTVKIVDGKERPLDRPKVKNIKHILETENKLNVSQMATNRQIRLNLNRLKELGGK